jgi:hypothetical protein
MIISFLYQRLVTNDHDNHESILTGLYTYANALKPGMIPIAFSYCLRRTAVQVGDGSWRKSIQELRYPLPGQRLPKTDGKITIFLHG